MGVGVTSRRGAMLGLGWLLAAPALALAQAARPGFAAIRVDVSPLRAKGYGPVADWVAQDLPGALRDAFAADMAAKGERGAATLLARIDSVVLGSEERDRFGFGRPRLASAARDSIEGVGVAGGATTSLLCAISAETGLMLPDEVVQRRRVAALCQSFAYWLPRQMGL